MSTKRKLPRRKLPWISNLLDHLPYSKLPTKLVVLQRLFFEIESGYPLSPALSTVQQELKALWAYAGYEDILMSNSNIVREIRKLHKSYKDLIKFDVAKRELPRFKKKEELFLDQLPVLFNITVKSLIPSNLITAEDRSFLLHNWDKTISSTLDVTTKQAVEKKLVRHEKSRKFTSSHSSNPSSSSVASPPPSSSPPPSPAQSTSSSPSPTPKRRRLTGTTLEVPPDILSRVAPVSDRLSLTHNQLTVITAALVNHCGGDIHKIALSKSTSRRSRDSRRRSVVTTIKRNFSCAVGQVNFDGKLLPNLYGYGKVNRLAVVLVKENVNQLLCITETADSTGLIEARAVEAALNDWGCAEKIVAMGFDTTASNTGVHRGACTFLQLQLQRQLLWLACRHHIAELILRSAFDSLFGDTTGPEVVLFKVLRKTWDSIDLQNIQLPDRIPAVYRGRVDPLLAFIDNRLDPANRDLLPRCDYKEYLELAKLFLGGSITREKGYVYSIQRPGADHHARWMSKAIYILKMSLVQHQIPALHWTQKKKVAKMALFVVFVYLEAWFLAAVLVSAASNDLALYKRADSFKAVDKKVSRSATKVLNRHTWYLTEELIALAIFDEGLPKETRDLIAAKIGNLDVEEFEIKKPSLPTITAATAVSDFVGPRSRIVFDLLEVPTNFLREEDWQLQPEYSTTKRILETFTPVNDCTERALALATNYNSKITRNEESYQKLLLVVEEHRKKFAITTKADLLNLY